MNEFAKVLAIPRVKEKLEEIQKALMKPNKIKYDQFILRNTTGKDTICALICYSGEDKRIPKLMIGWSLALGSFGVVMKMVPVNFNIADETYHVSDNPHDLRAVKIQFQSKNNWNLQPVTWEKACKEAEKLRQKNKNRGFGDTAVVVENNMILTVTKLAPGNPFGKLDEENNRFILNPDLQTADNDTERKLEYVIKMILEFLKNSYATPQFGPELVHRDIKPENILYDSKEGFTILDYGIAIEPGDEKGNIEGTLMTIPPEIADPKVITLSTKADIHSIGGLILALLNRAGADPYANKFAVPTPNFNRMSQAEYKRKVTEFKKQVINTPYKIDIAVRPELNSAFFFPLANLSQDELNQLQDINISKLSLSEEHIAVFEKIKATDNFSYKNLSFTLEEFNALQNLLVINEKFKNLSLKIQKVTLSERLTQIIKEMLDPDPEHRPELLVILKNFTSLLNACYAHNPKQADVYAVKQKVVVKNNYRNGQMFKPVLKLHEKNKIVIPQKKTDQYRKTLSF